MSAPAIFRILARRTAGSQLGPAQAYLKIDGVLYGAVTRDEAQRHVDAIVLVSPNVKYSVVEVYQTTVLNAERKVVGWVTNDEAGDERGRREQRAGRWWYAIAGKPASLLPTSFFSTLDDAVRALIEFNATVEDL